MSYQNGRFVPITDYPVFTPADVENLERAVPAAQAVTMAFVSLVLIQFFKAYSFRSERHSILERPFANRWLNWAILWELGLLGLVLYLPFLASAFGTYPLSLVDWAILVPAAFTIVPALEAAKRMERAGWFGAWLEISHLGLAGCCAAGVPPGPLGRGGAHAVARRGAQPVGAIGREAPRL